MLNKISNWYFSKSVLPYWAVLIADSLLIMFSGIASYALVYGVGDAIVNFAELIVTLLFFMPGYWLGMRMFHTYSGILRYSSVNDLTRILGALLVGTVIAFAFHRVLCFFPHWDIHNVMALTLAVSFMMSSILCLSMRLAVKYLYKGLLYQHCQQRAFVYGVQEAGQALARSINDDKASPYVLSGFLSDYEQMSGHRLLGVKVYKYNDNIVETMRQLRIRAIFISPLRAASFRKNNAFIDQLIKNDIRIMMQPVGIEWDGHSQLHFNQLSEVKVEDLLPRDKIEVDLVAIGKLLKDKVVLITGAAGSIGYEITRQVATFAPKRMVLIDQAESPMHDVRLFMAKHHPELDCTSIVSSITNAIKMEAVFSESKPDYVFHAAAYKHVPMMEDNPSEAVQNNVYGTRVIADLAVKYGTHKFVMVSTDKAVNPTNVMGCSKRICEIYCQSLNAEINRTPRDATEPTMKQWNGEPAITQFITTRFGNVLGSNGSVVPIFREQIRHGGPVTVTHPDIIRFFMLIPEACRLVLEAGTMGQGGEIFVFDMGEPVRIADLAQRMIDMSRAEGVKIEYTGLRNGEKLYEEVLSENESNKPTTHPKIMVASVREYPYGLALRNEEELYDLSFTNDDMAIVKKMKEIVPEYRSRNSKYEALDKEQASR